ncbi:MAG: amino acid ABC transporter permease [Nocardioidaceae bacterium]|nr:amino acid ABC transporter permease [Nocardioidaceae bacterium]
MSLVLFDQPGPRARARQRVFNVLALVLVAGLLALIVWRLHDRGQLEYRLWEPFVTPAYIQAILVDGLLKTLQAAGTSIVLAVVFGLLFGVGKLSDHAWVRWPSWAVVEFFRAVPLLLLITFVFFTFGVGDGFGPYWSLVVGLTLYNGSVLAEIFRAGILAVPAGQGEAASALGMRKTQVMTLVLLPQAVKIMLPSLISQCVVALKDTSLGAYILAPGLTFIGRSVYTEFQNQVPTAIVLAALYIAVNLVLTAVATWAQRRYVGEKSLVVPMVGDGASGLAPAGQRSI